MDYEQRQKLIIFLLSKVLDNFDEVEDILSVDETMDLDIDYEYQAFWANPILNYPQWSGRKLLWYAKMILKILPSY